MLLNLSCLLILIQLNILTIYNKESKCVLWGTQAKVKEVIQILGYLEFSSIFSMLISMLRHLIPFYKRLELVYLYIIFYKLNDWRIKSNFFYELVSGFFLYIIKLWKLIELHAVSQSCPAPHSHLAAVQCHRSLLHHLLFIFFLSPYFLQLVQRFKLATFRSCARFSYPKTTSATCTICFLLNRVVKSDLCWKSAGISASLGSTQHH